MRSEQFAELRKAAAQRFLQSALLIDDEATFGPLIDDQPKVAKPPVVSVLDGVHEAPDAPKPATPIKRAPSSLDAKALTDAFLKQSVICGVFRPDPGEDAATLSAGAALHADIVIVDWYLEGSDSTRAKSIILTLLKDDAKRRGRLRLIVVYTSNPGRAGMATELFTQIDAAAETAGKFTQNHATLVGPSTRIVFVNKSGTTGAAAAEMATEGDLPDRLMTEFAALAHGLLPAFAVSAIAVVREATPHILSLFSNSLDGAYVGHRCALPDPDDAEKFAVELISDELKSVIETEEVAEKHLGAPVLGAWIDTQADRSFGDGTTEIPSKTLKNLIRNGQDAFAAGAQHKFGDAAKEAPRKIKIANVSRVFYEDDAKTLQSNLRLARLSTFRSEALFGPPKPDDWRPFLSLGSVIKPLMPAGNPNFLICLQPGCDSIRLDGDTTFPFQTAIIVEENFNVIIKHDNDYGSLVRIGGKPRDGLMIEFARNEKAKRVVAKKARGKSEYEFTDRKGKKYRWVGDLKAMKAQSLASQIGARMHSVALDDFEWLRRSHKGS